MGLDDKSVCYTLDLKNSSIDSNSIQHLENWIEKEQLQLFKLKNGSTRIVACIDTSIYDTIIAETSLLLRRGIDVNMLEDKVTMITVDQLMQEMDNE